LPFVGQQHVEPVQPQVDLDEPGDVRVVVRHEDQVGPIPGRGGHGRPVARRAASRSARTAAAGSAAPYTAVPATKASAPASAACAMVSALIPPSTSMRT